MKKIIYAISMLFVVMNYSVYGQDEKVRSDVKDEISFSTNNLNFDKLSLKYARKVSNDWWLKVGLINLGINSYERNPYKGSFKSTETAINGGLLVGIDKEKPITEKLSLLMGINTQMTYNYSNYHTENFSIPVSQRDNKVYKYIPGIGLGLGFFYHINDNILLGAEINPTVTYYYEDSKIDNMNVWYKKKGYDFSLNSSSGFLTLKYRF